MAEHAGQAGIRNPLIMVRRHRLARNALLYLIGLVVPLIVALITVPIMIRGLGTERFGVFSVAWLLLTYLAELGFGVTTTRYAAEAIGAGRTNEVAAIAWSTAALQAFAGLIIGGALALATPWLAGSIFNIPGAILPEARAALYFLAVSLPLLGWGRAFRGVVEAAQRFDLALAVHIPITAGAYLLAAWGASAGFSITAVMAIIVGARVLALPAYFLAARAALPNVPLRPVFRTNKLGHIGRFAGWVAVSTAVSPLLLYLDRFMIGALLSMTAVAFYAAPYEIVARLTLIPGAAMGALFPALSQMQAAESKQDVPDLAARSARMLLFVLAPVIVLVLGGAHDGLNLWLGPEYAAQSSVALQILALGVLVNALAHVPYVLLQSAGRADLPARFHLLELPVQFVMAWLLITGFGITGAALAWTLRMTLDATLLFTAAVRLGLLNTAAMRAQLQAALLLSLTLLCAGALAAGALLPSAFARIGVSIALALAAAALLWFGAPDQERRRIITALFRPAV